MQVVPSSRRSRQEALYADPPPETYRDVRMLSACDRNKGEAL